jgi:aryl-alcohol dehydrogenase-like predicted oxidoreductase
MKYRYLGKTGLLVSRICLGAMNFGADGWGCDKETSIAIIRAFLEAGGNFIDTADAYNKGISEAIVGEALRSFDRGQAVLATKVYSPMKPDPNGKGLSRKHIMEACEASLKRLGTDYIDLYQIHGPDPRTPWEETMRALDDLVRQGKVRYIGCSNLYAWQIMKANGISARWNQERFSCGQFMYNLIIRDVEREVLPACDDQGMGFICWSPLASGMLTGKYQKAEKPEEGTRIALRSIDLPRYWHERGFRIAAAVQELAQSAGKTPSELALAWLLHDHRVTAVISGSRRVEQVQQNLTVGDWDLPDDLWHRLNEATAFEPGYPFSWISSSHASNFKDAEF